MLKSSALHGATRSPMDVKSVTCSNRTSILCLFSIRVVSAGQRSLPEASGRSPMM